jgi:hypothetical protein
MAGILQAFAGKSVEEYADAADSFLRAGKHPTLGRTFHTCGYLPMVELLRYLEANGFTNYIASGGDRDFMRPVTEEIYGIPSERVIGSSNALRYLEDEHGGTLAYAAEPDVFDDGPVKPVRIWEPDRPAPDRVRRQGAAGAAPARAPRRRGARVQLHSGRRTIARAGCDERLDRRQHEGRLGDRLRRMNQEWPSTAT